ncbi:MAG: MBL fold metallo-hydrolase [Verrucomicrobia bacterium]|nr:MAG: MBL fold metallo-hydrolase [Verrucomicrobiota bacterium]
MKLTDLNRHGGIGANCHLIEVGGLRLVVDCGFHPKLSGAAAAPALEFLDEHEPDAVLVTHCHLDHLGALPMVTRRFPDIPVLMSQPSAMLAERLLRNSVNVMKRERAEKGMTEYPLYTMREVDATMRRVVPMLFGQPRRMTTGEDEVEITFHQAGHVAGAAGIELRYGHQSAFITGDVQFDAQRVIGGARFPAKHFDIVVTETTRGATESRPSGARASEVDRLLVAIDKTIKRGGSVLIPVFALGRMQEIFVVLNEARQAGRLPDVPIFAAGLGMDICNYFDEITRQTGITRFHRSVLRDLRVKPPPRNMRVGRAPSEQGIYVLSSGMLVENTPSYQFATGIVGRSEHTVCFVGYCDPDTPGGQLLATKQGEVFVFDAADYQTPVRAHIEQFDMTGHADRDELLEFALQADPRAVVLTHGDPPARAWFAERFAELAPKLKVLDPEPLKSYDV